MKATRHFQSLKHKMIMMMSAPKPPSFIRMELPKLVKKLGTHITIKTANIGSKIKCAIKLNYWKILDDILTL